MEPEGRDVLDLGLMGLVGFMGSMGICIGLIYRVSGFIWGLVGVI